MLVRPKRGLVLRDPETMQLVPDEGLEVPDTSPVWNRIIADGDAVVVKAEAAPALQKKEAGQ